MVSMIFLNVNYFFTSLFRLNIMFTLSRITDFSKNKFTSIIFLVQTINFRKILRKF